MSKVILRQLDNLVKEGATKITVKCISNTVLDASKGTVYQATIIGNEVVRGELDYLMIADDSGYHVIFDRESDHENWFVNSFELMLETAY